MPMKRREWRRGRGTVSCAENYQTWATRGDDLSGPKHSELIWFGPEIAAIRAVNSRRFHHIRALHARYPFHSLLHRLALSARRHRDGAGAGAARSYHRLP